MRSSILALAGTAFLFGCAPNDILADSEYPTFQANVATLEKMRAYIESDDRYQTESKMQAIIRSFPEIQQDLGLKTLRSEGEVTGTYLYASDGTDFKIVLSNSGHCYLALKLKPELVDPRRSRGGDCYSYGYWTENAEKF